MDTKNKVTIIGAGMVGSTTAHTLIENEITEEIALIDINKKLVASQVMDLQHAVPFSSYTKVKVGTYSDIQDSKVVVFSAGAAQQGPKQSRLDLVTTNVNILESTLPHIFKANPSVVLIIVTNPLDILTYRAVKKYPSKKRQIFGTGTLLDSARFRVLLGQKLGINPSSVHAYIVGEHGDSEVPLWSIADVGGAPLDRVKKISATEKKKIFESAKNAAYAIIAGKQSTYYAIASGTTSVVRAVLYDQKTVLPVSRLIEGEYGIRDVCLSLPAIIGHGGIVRPITPNISAMEIKQLKKSAAQLKKVLSSI